MNMRRLLCIVLLLLAPLQASWAATSVYCTHEIGMAANHFGHHDHQHDKVYDRDGPTGDPTKTGGIDSDCAGCHVNGGLVLPSVTVLVSVPALTIEPFKAPNLPASHAQFPPERPPWRIPA